MGESWIEFATGITYLKKYLRISGWKMEIYIGSTKAKASGVFAMEILIDQVVGIKE
jgi:hypothetical protein